jgi:DNA-binding SARP family transcriptional activator
MRLITALRRGASRVAKALLLLALLAGIPYGLITLIGWPLPRQRPTTDQLRHLLTTPVTDTLVLDTLAVALWILWACFTLSVLLELTAAVRGVPVPHLRLLSPTQALAGWLLTGIVTGVLATGAPLSTATAPAHPPAQSLLHAQRVAVTFAAPGPRAATVHSGQLTVTVGRAHYSYPVQPGDNLSHIARDWLGDADRWPEIYRLNKGRHFPAVGGTLTNPNLIYPGWLLILPTDARPPHPSTVVPRKPPPTVAPPSAGAPTPAAPPSSPPSTTPSPAEPSPAPASNSAPAPAGGGDTSAPAAAGSGQKPERGAQHRPTAGVDLPGGWVSLPLAAAIALAGTTVWLRRRRRYKPGRLAGPVLHDPDMRPLPAVVDQARRAVRRQAPDLLRPPRDTLTVRQAAQMRRVGTPLPAPPPPPPHGPHLAGLPDPLPPGGLGLTGPGAEDATRGLLVAMLSAGTPDDPDARGEVIIPAATLATLLGAAAVELGDLPRMTVTADLPGALTHVEELIITRRRLVEEEDAADVDALRTDPFHPPMPLALLIAEVPDPPLRARLSTALHLGRPLAVAAALLGEWPRGQTTHVNPQGATDADPQQRLATVDVATANEVLHVLREAHTGQRDSHGPTDPVESPSPTGQDTAAATPAADAQPAPATGTPPAAAESPTMRGNDGRARAHAQVLGPPALYLLDHTPVDGLREVALELLVYLAVHREGASLDDIKEAVYGDATRKSATQRLQNDVSNLRNRIRHILGITAEDGDPVINTGGHYHLNPDLVSVDWWTVQDALAAATATTDPEQQRSLLQAARDAFGGTLAEDAEYEWVLQDQEHVRRQGVILHTQLAALTGEANPDQAAELLEAACVLDPFNEDLAQSTMRAHARTGNPDAVKARLRALKSALDELDEEPDDATRDLANDLVVGLRRPPAGPRPAE